MDYIFNIVTLLGGLAFFLYGMDRMSNSLEKMAGGKLEEMLKKMTSNPLKSIVLGMGITVAIQSSSALTVMLVGLVNSGIMQVSQTIFEIFGSNIGTTLTAWILSLTGLESDVFWLKMLKPENFAPAFAFVGIILFMLSKSSKKRSIGSILVGFAILMFGMTLMADSVSPLVETPAFRELLLMFDNPIVAVIISTAFTGIIQSSAAAIGIVQALAVTGNITVGMSIPLVLGLNIGTCATALISSIGVSRKARKVAIIHTLIKIIGMLVFMIPIYTANAIVHFSFFSKPIDAVGIAAMHTAFNIINTIILFPFPKALEKLADKIINENKGHDKQSFIDERLLNTPSVAINECFVKTVEMAKIARSSLLTAIKLTQNYDTKLREQIQANEEQLDKYEDKLGTYLVKVSSKSLSDHDSHQVTMQLHSINDFERIGDHAVNLLKSADEMHEKKISFSSVARKELAMLTDAIEEILDITTDAFDNEDIAAAKRVEPLEQVIDRLIMDIKAKHIARLQKGDCTIEMGFVLNDMLNDFERVSDHCSNVAVAIIEVQRNSFATHKYLGGIKVSNEDFIAQYDAFMSKYASHIEE